MLAGLEFLGAHGHRFTPLVGHCNGPLERLGAPVQPTAVGVDFAHLLTHISDVLAIGGNGSSHRLALLGQCLDVELGLGIGALALCELCNGVGVLEPEQGYLGGVELMADVAVLLGGIRLAAQTTQTRLQLSTDVFAPAHVGVGFTQAAHGFVAPLLVHTNVGRIFEEATPLLGA